jgi:hypothetical protein
MKEFFKWLESRVVGLTVNFHGPVIFNLFRGGGKRASSVRRLPAPVQMQSQARAPLKVNLLGLDRAAREIECERASGRASWEQTLRDLNSRR